MTEAIFLLPRCSSSIRAISRRAGATAGVTLTGTRILLEPLSEAHAQPLAAVAQHGRDRYLLTDVPADVEDARRYVAEALAQRAKNAAVPFAIVDRHTGRVIGSTRFCYFEYWHWKPQYRERDPQRPDAAQIGGTWLALDAQRTGASREAKLLMLQVAFERWELTRIRLRTDARNQRSRDAIAGIGAHFDGILRADSAGYDGSARDSAAFSVLRTEWPEVRTHLIRALNSPRQSAMGQ